MTILKELHWIAIDWGSSNLRVWALDNNNAILDSISSDDGMLGLATSEFEPLFFEKISKCCLLYTSPSPRDGTLSRMPFSA